MKRSKLNISLYDYPATIDKEAIKSLPLARFDGKIYVVDTLEMVDFAAKRLSKEKVLGIDTETKPSFQAGKVNPVALIQLSSSKECFLFRINKIGLCPPLLEILENVDILKVGLSLKDDLHAIRRAGNVEARHFIELQRLCPAYGIKEQGLQSIYAIVFGQYISKKQRMSNWQAKELTKAQQEYAALDAWATLQIFKTLMKNPIPNPANFALL